MPKTKISEFSSTPANNTDIDSINIAEGCAPSGINDAIRELMSQLKDFQTGAVGDSFNGPVGSTTASTGAFTTVTATSAATTNSEARSVIKLADTSSVAQGNGGGLLFRGVYTGTTLVDAASVQAYKANATDNDYSYGLAFVTRANGGNLTANMKLDQSGNLGLGVTPSTLDIGKTIQVGFNSNTIWGATANNFQFLAGATYNNAYLYAVTGSAVSNYRQNAGQHQWYNAPSGTAGNAITFTQAMTLDASGNLLLGTTTPTYQASGRGLFEVNGSSSALLALKTGNAGRGYIYTQGTDLIVSSETGANTFQTANASPVIFATNGSERARIDSSGNLLCGTTSSSNTPSQGITLMQNTNVGSIGIGHANGTSSGNGYMNFAYNGSAIGSITQNGTTAVSYNTTSDQRLKENIQDADSASSLIDSLQVRQFDWITDKTHQRYGFIAQELVNVAPEAVNQPADPEAMMAVDYSKLVPMLVKEVQALRQRVAQLEAQ